MNKYIVILLYIYSWFLSILG